MSPIATRNDLLPSELNNLEIINVESLINYYEMFRAEQLAAEFEQGHRDYKLSGSGKNRTKNEMTDNKFQVLGGHTRKLVQNWQQNNTNSNAIRK
uniref:Uncharacterized protein n=1 Tax=Ditylenchus dipsaci TaxID=166011 RepID=A0A915D6I7_9BILA